MSEKARKGELAGAASADGRMQGAAGADGRQQDAASTANADERMQDAAEGSRRERATTSVPGAPVGADASGDGAAAGAGPSGSEPRPGRDPKAERARTAARNVWLVFSGDVRNLLRNVIAAIVVVGLVLVPPLYAWFTTLGFWDPYANTGNLAVAVANNDKGYKSDLVPVTVNVGDDVVSALRANDQFHWVFVDGAQAIDGVESGAYYAAIVMPESFSADMLSVLGGKVSHSDIVYYSNDKANAIAPRVTATGASTLQEEVDAAFTKTVADIALGTTSDLSDYLTGEGVANYAQAMLGRLDDVLGELASARSQIDLLAALVDTMTTLLGASGDVLQDASQTAEQLRPLLEEARQGAASLEGEVPPGVADDLRAEVTALGDKLAGAAQQTEGLVSGLDGAAGSIASSAQALTGSLQDVGGALGSAATTVDTASEELGVIRDSLRSALESGDLELVRTIIGNDPEAAAAFLAAPTKLVRHAVYPMADNGSAMSPFYSSLALWIGAIFLVALTRVDVGERRLRTLTDPKPWQLYLGRYGVFALMALAQATVLCVGNVLLLGVQCEHFWLYLLAGWLAAIVFSNLVYTLTVSFGNVGKAMAIVLLVMQLAGSGGIFPVQMSAPFFQAVYPWLPFAHSMEAFQGCIAGIYGSQYWASMGLLAALLVPSLLLGLVLRNPIVRLVGYLNRKLDETKLV